MNDAALRTTMLAAIALTGVSMIAAMTLRTPLRQRICPLLGIALGGLGVLLGALAWAGNSGEVTIGTALPGVSASFGPDRLGGMFTVLIGAVTVLASIWAMDGARSPGNPAGSRITWAAYPVFVLGMLGVCAAADVFAFLLAWEVMAVGSAVLVLTEHAQRAEVATAGYWYAAMTQLSFLLLLGGFAVLASAGSGTDWTALATAPPRAASTGVAVALLLLGFATKAGAVPLHVWLPRAHPEAPSHVSALMSAAMVKVGVYGVLLVFLRLFPGGPQWWGLLVLALGCLSAVFGILQAAVAADLKRLLAYSTTENIGLILLAIGAAQVLTARGEGGVAQVLLVAAMLLVLAHAAAKSTLFLTAGSVLHATGSRNLDRLGGLGAVMPWTAAGFGVAALGAAALPVTAGFVAEWTLLQALVRAGGPDRPGTGLLSAIAVTVVALTAGLALMTFTKAFGIAFLGRARSQGAVDAHEVAIGERTATALGAAAVLLLGLLPGPVSVAVAQGLGLAPDTVGGAGLLGGVRLAEFTAEGVTDSSGSVTPQAVPLLDPVALTVLAIVAAVLIGLVAARLRQRMPRRAVELGWGCGGARLSPRMQYTATSYAEPLVRIFDGPLGADRSIATTHGEAPYVVRGITFRQRVADVVEERGYTPVLRLISAGSDRARRAHNGNLHRYLGWSFLTFLLVLAWAVR